MLCSHDIFSSSSGIHPIRGSSTDAAAVRGYLGCNSLPGLPDFTFERTINAFVEVSIRPASTRIWAEGFKVDTIETAWSDI